MAPQQQVAARITSLDPKLIEHDYQNIELEKIDVPQPGPGQALIKIHLRPVNPTDFLSAGGRYPNMESRLPLTAGSEGIGTVVESASGKFKEGQRVVAAAVGWQDGTWQEYSAVDESILLAVPDGLADATAAQFYINPVTAVGLVDSADVPKGKYLLQGAAGSALGRQIIQYARHKGIKTISIVRRAEQVDELKALGADEVINEKKEEVAKRVAEITGGAGAWAALDPVGGDFTHTLLESIRQDGTVWVYGLLSGDTLTIKIMDIMVTGKGLRGFVLPKWLHAAGAEKAQERLQRTLQLLADGVIKPQTVSATFPLTDVHEAIAAHQKTTGSLGKVFISS